MKNLALYLTINYPSRASFFEILDVIEAFQIGYVEIGIPVTNPHVDGAVVRRTQEEVFPKLTTQEIESVLSEVRKRYSFKIILMTYYEGVEYFNLNQLSQKLYDAVLCVDKELNSERFSGLVHTFNCGMDQKEVDRQLSQSSQFIYLVSGEGKTGEMAQLPNDYKEILPSIKSKTELPVFVGFGVKEPKDITSILKSGADGAIIGSEFIKQFNEAGFSGIKNYLTDIQTAY